ncbi:hypothetical protein CMO93_06040 [Candidatus Woesearchaeota archaeon]|nr:hypothetical protein [Candidatus Woesearchaeota archaeon]|tara:strand:- start:12438 stop:13385 length:948 start_codon:yes stop_codon:yes gene_type:complete
MGKKLNIGGQAVMEGLMIRSPRYNVIGVRKKKKIILKKEKIKQRKGKFYKLFIIRGFFNLVDMLALGMRSLMWSADQQLEEEDEKISKKEMTFSVIFAILFGVGLFILLPYVATNLIGFYEESQPLLFNFIDGIIKIGILLLYILGISLLKDVKRLFQYHGAEHKAVHCYEKGEKLTIENARKYSTLHARCGTAFIMIVVVIALLVFSIITPIILMLFPQLLNMHAVPRRIILILIRLSLLPLIAGIAYEFLKFSAKHEKNRIIKILIWPGLFLQKITTKEPTIKQIEVAIEVVKKVLQLEKRENSKNEFSGVHR